MSEVDGRALDWLYADSEGVVDLPLSLQPFQSMRSDKQQNISNGRRGRYEKGGRAR